jgi:hypothetical protein
VKSLRRADHSFRGVLPSVVCLSMIVNPRYPGGPEPLGLLCHGKNIINCGTGYFCWYTVAQLVEALRYNPEGRGFDSQLCHWIFSLT